MKIVNIEESSERQALEHEAPVLCVVVNPQETLLVSRGVTLWAKDRAR